MFRRKQKSWRIDYGKNGNLDDVAVSDVELFRLEYMDDNHIWIRLYRKKKRDIVFTLTAKGKISGFHEFD